MLNPSERIANFIQSGLKFLRAKQQLNIPTPPTEQEIFVFPQANDTSNPWEHIPGLPQGKLSVDFRQKLLTEFLDQNPTEA